MQEHKVIAFFNNGNEKLFCKDLESYLAMGYEIVRVDRMARHEDAHFFHAPALVYILKREAQMRNV